MSTQKLEALRLRKELPHSRNRIWKNIPHRRFRHYLHNQIGGVEGEMDKPRKYQASGRLYEWKGSDISSKCAVNL